MLSNELQNAGNITMTIADLTHLRKHVAAINIQKPIEVEGFGLILNVGKSVDCYRLRLALVSIDPYTMCIGLSSA